MPDNNKKQPAPQRKEKARRFPSKNIKHDPNAESARAVFGLHSGGLQVPPDERR